MQTYTSANTSINSTKLPKVYSSVEMTGLVLDYGCGRYIGHIRTHLKQSGAELLPYDPYNQTPEVNSGSMNIVNKALRTGRKLNIVCSNVLNVIDDDATVKRIAKRLEYLATKSGGRAYITVYEGNKSGVGRRTGTDQYQRNEPLRNYLQWFSNARISKGMIVIGG